MTEKNAFADRMLNPKQSIDIAKECKAEPGNVTHEQGNIWTVEQLLRDAPQLQSDTAWHLSCLSASHFESGGPHQHVCMYYTCKHLKDPVSSGCN